MSNFKYGSKIFNENLIIIDSESKTKEEALHELSVLGKENGVVLKISDLENGFKARELEGSTGLEDGFAIPHARISQIKEARIAFIRFKEEIEWETLDNSKVKVAIALMVPDDDNSKEHITLMSKVAQKLIEQEIKDNLKKEVNVEKIIDLLFNEEPIKRDEKQTEKQGYLIAITGCPAGVAHTYMSAKKIADYATEKGWQVKVEKQGANGIEDRLTSDDVKNANALLISADINPRDIERFENIPTIRTSVAEPLHDMDNIWNKIINIKQNVDDQKIPTNQNASKEESLNFKAKFRKEAKSLKDAILTGISFVVPVIVAGTTIVALITIITQIAGADNIAQNANWLNELSSVAGQSLSVLLAPILAAYIAYAMADKPGLFPGFLGGLACNNIVRQKSIIIDGEETIVDVVNGLGFLGGLIVGILVGYMMIAFKKWMVSKKFQSVLTWFVYPVLSSLIIISLVLFGIGTPIAIVVEAIFDGLTKLQESGFAAIAGIIVGMLCVFDLGGPMNKVAWAFGFASFTQAQATGNMALLVPYTAFWAAGIGTGWTTTLVTTLGRKWCTKEEKDAGKISWVMSSLGITEGSIPLMLSDPFKVIPGFLVGGAVSGGLTYALGLGSTITGGGFITVAGVTSITGSMAVWAAILAFIGIAILGSLISTAIIIGLKALGANPELEEKIKIKTVKVLTFGKVNLPKKQNKIK
ncbi:fructose-specific PTS transporter subunit EIIC [Mesoplasma photuris]|uniref:fructose-specific PTS transporter subunit EIIC n=1 Tax=Mesoplasma photuris TaxID=217731 RepID=UPI000691863E|nr:fructose-specific PTS transporter subunit EIIC [Mesoplasma photuris]